MYVQLYADYEKEKGRPMFAYIYTRGRWRVKLLFIWNLALEGGGWSGSRCGRLTPGQTEFHCTGGWLVLGAGLDGTERLTPPGYDHQPA